MDKSASSAIAPGLDFVVFTEGEMLKHPVTGATLGPIEQTIASGRIVETHDNYSLGEILSPAPALKAGQKVRILPRTALPANVEPAPPAPKISSAKLVAPYYRSPLLELEATDIAVGDVHGDGFPEILIADKNSVRAYPFKTDGSAWQPSCSFTDENTGAHILSLDAADLNGDKKDEVFVTVNNKFFNRVESYVLACKDGKFHKVASLPWMIRSFTEPDGTVRLAAQQLVDDGSFPLSNLYALQYADGKYTVSKQRLNYKRLNWLYGFGLASREGTTLPIFYTSANRIRIQFPKTSWSSEETFGQTSNRVRWREKTFQFHPRLILENGPEGLTGIYTLKNIPRFGSLSESFGVFNRAELHYLRWNGISLEPDWSVDLGGYAAGLAALGPANGRPLELLVAVVGSSERTSIWFFRPPSSGTAQLQR